MMYNISKGEADSLKDFIRYYFVQSIRDDEEVDSLLYLYNVLKVYERLGGLEEDYDDYEPDTK